VLGILWLIGAVMQGRLSVRVALAIELMAALLHAASVAALS